MLREHLDPEKLHHAHVIIGSSLSDAQKNIEQFVSEDMHVSTHGNPDVFLEIYESVGIDDITRISDAHQRTPLGEKKVLIIIATGITMQAQNSLLKMIEEPTPSTYFFFALPTASLLLPTVLSRVSVIELHPDHKRDEESIKKDPRISEFLTGTPSLRLEMVKELLSDLDKERIVKEDAFQFVSAIEREAYEAIHSQTERPDSEVYRRETLMVLARVSDYLRDPSSSLKMLLEYLSLRLPRVR